MKKLSEVFGVSNEILNESYVDRGNLDEDLRRHLELPEHICIRGESKSGKSWLRKRIMPSGIVVQCRLEKSVLDIYTDALSQLDVTFEKSTKTDKKYAGTVSGTGDFGWKLIAKVQAKLGLDVSFSKQTEFSKVGRNIEDLKFIAELIKESGRRLVVEDFHYMSIGERKLFAHELKTLWDYGLMVVVVGIWNDQNMLMFLNPDLTGRVHEFSISWAKGELAHVLEKGGKALCITFSDEFQSKIVGDCYGNIGVLQKIVQTCLMSMDVLSTQVNWTEINNVSSLELSCLQYAEQLNPLYQQFAKVLSDGIRKRDNSTAIYAHAMNVIVQQSDDKLISGLSRDEIYMIAHAREPRIQSGNMHQILSKLDSLQIDQDGRNLVLSYNEMTKEVFVVDRQFLFYRKYCTVKWPWEDLIAELAVK